MQNFYSTLFKNWIYPITQRIQRRDFRTYLEIALHNQTLDREQIKEIQFKKLSALIKHAYKNVPYYRSSFSQAGVIPEDIKSLEDVSKLPVLTKDQLRDNQKFFRSEIIRSPVYKIRTSGSTGKPLTFYKSQFSAMSAHITRIRAYEWWGIELGDRNIRLGNFGLLIPYNLQNIFRTRISLPIKHRIMNRKTMPAYNLTPEVMQHYQRLLTDFSPKYIIGFPSAIAAFAYYLVDNGFDPSDTIIKAVVSTGELLLDWQEEIINDAFDRPIINKYGTVEVDEIAFRYPCGEFHIMDDFVFIEILKDNPEDEFGMVVVTLLNELSYPLIRYNIEDIAKSINEPDSCKFGLGYSTLEGLSGRSNDLIQLPSGRLLSGFILHRIIKTTKGIKQFQAVQKKPDFFEITIVPDENIYEKSQEKNIHHYISKHLEGATATINYVDHFPRDKSGKYSYIKSEVWNRT